MTRTKGTAKPSRFEVREPRPFGRADIIRLRERLGLSQTVFAAVLGKSDSTIRSWEQGQKAPDPAANRILEIAERHPRVVLEFVGKPSRVGSNAVAAKRGKRAVK